MKSGVVVLLMSCALLLVSCAPSPTPSFSITFNASCYPSPPSINSTSPFVFVNFSQPNAGVACAVTIPSQQSVIVSQGNPANNVLVALNGSQILYTVSRLYGVPSGPCTIPTNRMTLSGTVMLCPGSYYLPTGILLSNNTYLDCQGAELVTDNIAITIPSASRHDNITVENCNIRGTSRSSGMGIWVGHVTTNVLIKTNNISDMNTGVWVLGSSNVSVVDNVIFSGDRVGIELESVSDTVVRDNYVHNIARWRGELDCEGFGLVDEHEVLTSENVLIENNVFENNCVGVGWGVDRISGSQPTFFINHSLQFNNITNSVKQGFWGVVGGSITQYTNNRLLRNNFINNNPHAQDDLNNSYANNFFGTCLDQNNDNICDTPYKIPGAARNVDPTPSAVLN